MRARPGVSSVWRVCARRTAVAIVPGAMVLAAALVPGIARAQLDPPAPEAARPSALDRAIAHAEDADFASALASFEEAESSSDLSRAELERLFSHRATVHFALGEVAAMEADLARLLGIAPAAQLPESAPPPVIEALERLRGGITPPTLVVDARPVDGGLEVRARVGEGGADLVRGLRAHARVAPDGAWQHGEGGAVAIDAPPRAQIDWFAQALGPGGVIVASEGSADDPRTTVVPEPSIAAASPASDDEVWWAIGGGGAAVVLGAIAAGVAIAMTSTTTTTIGGPELVP